MKKSTRKQALIIPAVKSLREAVNKYSNEYDFTLGTFKHLEININKDGVSVFYKGKDIREFDKVWLTSTWKTRDIAYAVHLYLDAYNVSHTSTEQTSSKITDQMILALSGLRTPNTWYSSGRIASAYMKSIESFCTYPMIIKDILGSRGKNAMFISCVQEFAPSNMALPSTKNYLIQEFIPNDYEWGVLVANNTIVSAEKSFRKPEEFRNHACHGATEFFVPVQEIPANIQDLVLKSAASLNLSWCRVDILEDKNTGVPYVLEVNRFPGITSKSDEVSAAEVFLGKFLEI